MADDTFGEVDDTVYGEVVAGLYVIDGSCRFELEMERLWKEVVFAWCSHGTDTYASEFQHPGAGRAIDDGYFAAIEFNERIVDTHAMEGRHKMFDGGNGLTTATEGGAT